MAYLPSLSKKRTKQLVTATFGGINRAEKAGDGEFASALNLSTREYPMLCPRKPRGTVRTLSNPAGMIAKSALCWVDGASVFYDGAAVEGITLSTAAADTPKRLVGFGAYVVIFPDKKYFNTIDPSDCGSLEDEYQSSGDVSYTMCRLDGEDYGTVQKSATEPSSPANGDYWIDTSETPHRLMIYSSTYGAWQQVLTVYTRITAAGINQHFKEGETITLSGIAGGAGASDTLKSQLEALNGSQYVYGAGENYITILGLLDEAYTQTSGTVEASRKTPDMEFVIEDGNRLWGCHYGKDADGNTLNEIYASKLGDFKNWRVYQGISTDSYAVSVGSDGPFTGAAAYNGYPMFFKEKCVHKIFGNQPKNYQVMTTQMRGVKDGCGQSLAIVDGTLVYMSTAGIEAYDGSLPTTLSLALGEAPRSNGVAGAIGTKYYLSCREEEQDKLYVYDMRYNIWHEEDGARAVCFAPHNDDLYMLDADTGEMVALLGSAGTLEEAVSWRAETGLMGWETINQKFITRFNLRAVLPAGAQMRAEIQYNSKGPWHEKMNLINKAASTRTLLMPVYPHRCDHMRLRLSGEGEIKLFSVARILSSGGDGQRG